jgi:hypothetical protein
MVTEKEIDEWAEELNEMAATYDELGYLNKNVNITGESFRQLVSRIANEGINSE